MTVRQNIDLAVMILSAIWLRKPIIINTNGIENDHKLQQEIISYIPDYRQLVFYGDVPRLLIFNKFRFKILKHEQSDITKQRLYQCFAEENINTPPLHVIYFNANQKGIKELHQIIERGWIAFVNGNFAMYKKLAALLRIDFIDLKTMHSPARKNISSNICIDSELFQRLGETSQGAFWALLQKKMNEIRYIGQALICEIESGKKLIQAEIEEIFAIDSAIFLTALEILKVESGIDISQYVRLSKIQGIDLTIFKET